MKQLTDPVRVLTTRAQYMRFAPFTQGYVIYMEADWPGSELHGLSNPYERESSQWSEWNRGQAVACQNVADIDDEG